VLPKSLIYHLRIYKFLGRFSRLVQIQYGHGYIFMPCMTEFSDLESTAMKSLSRFSRLVKIPVCQVPVGLKLLIYYLRLFKF
jgi:hypothetical protein